jgi:hypothetical protein
VENPVGNRVENLWTPCAKFDGSVEKPVENLKKSGGKLRKQRKIYYI